MIIELISIITLPFFIVTVSSSRNLLCTVNPDNVETVQLSETLDTVQLCWTAALKQQTSWLLVGSSGCELIQKQVKLDPVACTDSNSNSSVSYAVNVRHYLFQLERLHSDVQFWLTGTTPDGIEWSRPPNGAKIKDESDLASCIKVCRKYHHHFCLVDVQGCRCGRTKEGRLEIRHENLLHTQRHNRELKPAFVVKLVGAEVAGWSCTTAPSSFVEFTAAKTMQDALSVCKLRDYEYVASGEEGFFCGNNTDNLERFSMSQCEMQVTAQKSYSIVSIKEIEREMHIIENSVMEYILWWISEKPSGVFWTSLPEADSLEQCVRQCERRFVSVGADGCGCGSLRSETKHLELREWIKQQSIGSPQGQGYLILDKEGYIDVPEGWVCSTKPPIWKAENSTNFQRCLTECNQKDYKYVSVGRGGCACLNSTENIQHLQMVRCQNPYLDTAGFSLIRVDTWININTIYNEKPGYSYYWLAARPADVEWLVQPGNPVLEGCVHTCEKHRGVLLIILGVDGCECGIPVAEKFKTPQWSQLEWTTSPDSSSSRGFFLLLKSSPSEGYTMPDLDWTVTKDEFVRENHTDFDEPRMVRVNANTEYSGGIKRRQSYNSRDNTFYEYRNQSGNGTEGGDSRQVISGSGSHRSSGKSVEHRLSREHNKIATENTGGIERKEHERDTQKMNQVKRDRHSIDRNQRSFIKAGENAIVVGKASKTNVKVEEEEGAKLHQESYSKHSIAGEQTSKAVERITAGSTSTKQLLSHTKSKVLEKGVNANTSHANAAVNSHKLTRFVDREEYETTNREGTANKLIHRVEGLCFYKKNISTSDWLIVEGSTISGFQCLCDCVQKKQKAYAVVLEHKCYCTNDAMSLGTRVGLATSNTCSDPDTFLVYNGLKHAKQIITACSANQTTTKIPIFALEDDRENSGERTKHFTDKTYELSQKNTSLLAATHLRRQQDDTRQRSLKVHSRKGSTKESWKSRLRKGLLDKQYRLRLHLRREHKVKEKIHLNSRKDIRSSVQKGREIIRETGPREIGTKTDAEDVVNAQFENTAHIEHLAGVANRAQTQVEKNQTTV